MSAPVRTIGLDGTLTEAWSLLLEYGISCLAVVDDMLRPAGVISRRDLLRVGRTLDGRVGRAPSLTLPDGVVRDVLRADVVRVASTAPVASAARTMVAQRIHRVFVTDGAVFTGVISTMDVMRAIRDSRRSTPISEYMSTPVVTVRASDTLAVATEKLSHAPTQGVVVLDDEEWPVGLFTAYEALQCRDLTGAIPMDEPPALLCLDLKTPTHRAASRAAEGRVRRVIAVEGRRVSGILSGIEFARVAAQG